MATWSDVERWVARHDVLRRDARAIVFATGAGRAAMRIRAERITEAADDWLLMLVPIMAETRAQLRDALAPLRASATPDDARLSGLLAELFPPGR